ncbi:hypothetical protein, conserved [Eimeria maxima]|uniref:Uncharacterized protein n=1 Tax=Eimeria maxima TaxID=5804 RepID=U6MJK2_EIMMA|nr:hypothetical protein, conserved [Eimeria maxima]CDJ61835.1 hypothetical protein, conserved [Eimeria maxima]
MMRGRIDVKKLKFSTTELRSLALQTHFSVEEVQALYSGERKPLEGGLSAVSLLGLFNLSNACSFVFADRFVRLFWQHRTQDRGIEIGFEEFVRLLSIWTRGTPHQRLTRKRIALFEANSLRKLIFCWMERRIVYWYIVKEDIVDIMRSLFMCFLKSGVASYDWNSEEFKAKMAQEILSEWADAAIRRFHTADSNKLLWFSEFLQWIIHVPGVAESLCVPTDVWTWLFQE